MAAESKETGIANSLMPVSASQAIPHARLKFRAAPIGLDRGKRLRGTTFRRATP